MAVISAFDLSTRWQGFCSGSGQTLPECGAVCLDQHDDDIGACLAQFHGFLSHHFDAHRPDKVVVEAPMLNPRRDKLLTIRKIYSINAHLEWFCQAKGVECSEVSAKAIKTEVTGSHLAAKDDLVAVALQCGLRLPKPSHGQKDAADAFGGWLMALRHYDRATRSKWDTAIWSKRGFLI